MCNKSTATIAQGPFNRFSVWTILLRGQFVNCSMELIWRLTVITDMKGRGLGLQRVWRGWVPLYIQTYMDIVYQNPTGLGTRWFFNKGKKGRGVGI